MSKKPGRTCKICKLKKSHPEAHKRITAQIMKGSEISIQKLLKILNKEFNINITPMNYQSHKGHTLDGKVHELKKSGPTVEVFSKEGDLQYTNIEEIIENLNPKHKLFCEEYVNKCNRNGSKAYKEVYGIGTIDKTARNGAWAIRTIKDNMSYISHLTEIKREEIGVNENYVLEQTKELVDRCMQAEPVYDKDGDATGEWAFNAVGANKALSELGKYLKMDKNPDRQGDHTQFYDDLTQKIAENQISPVMALLELGKQKLPVQDLVKMLLNKADLSQITEGPQREGDDLKKASSEELNERLKLIESKRQKLCS